MTPEAKPAPAIVTLGDLVMDMTSSTPGGLHHATDTLGGIRANPGGSAANVAAWAARCGAPVRLVVRVGADVLGDALLADLRGDGVEVHAARDPARPTGIILVLVDESGERSMVVSPGANHSLEAADLPTGLLDGAGLLHLSGYSFFWDAPRGAARRAKEMALAAGLWLSIDPNSVALLRHPGPDAFWQEAAGAHILLPNLDEGRLLAGEEEPEAVLEKLARRVPLVALKLGGEGVLLAAGALRLRLPASPATAVDTTGAGDAWAAAFLTGLMRRAWQGPGHPPAPTEAQLREAALEANQLAAWVVGRPGARPRGGYPAPPARRSQP